MNYLKIPSETIGLRIYLIIQALLPVIVFFYVSGVTARIYFNRIQDVVDSWSLILGMVPHKTKILQTQ